MIYKAFAFILDSVCGIVYKKGDIMPKNYLLIYSEQLATMLPSSANYVCNLHSAADRKQQAGTSAKHLYTLCEADIDEQSAL